MKKRLLGILLSFALMLTMMPVLGLTQPAHATTDPALSITSPAVGQVIGNDGKNYDYSSKPQSVTAVAKIAYVDETNHKGLALAMTDESDTKYGYEADTAASAHTPAFTGGTWKLASKDEWENMINAAGGSSSLRGGFSSVGGTNMDGMYWSSTPDGAKKYYININSSIWYSAPQTTRVNVRACLTFDIVTTYPLWVGGTPVNSANAGDILGDQTASYVAESNTLTLNGATITKGLYVGDESDSEFGIYYNGSEPLIIDLADGSVNTVKIDWGADNEFGIYVGDQNEHHPGLNISGKGQLTVSGSDWGIYAPNITIDGCDVTASGGRGIHSYSGSIEIKAGSKVTASGGSKAIDGNVKNAIAGTGWTNTAGTEGMTAIEVSTTGQPLTNYKKVQFPAAHTHDFTYSASGTTITATCSADSCPLDDGTEQHNHTATVTIAATDASYTGSAYTGASLTDTRWTSAGLTLPTIEYTGRGSTSYDKSITAPTSVGTYTASVTVDTDKTATADFTISSTALTITGATATNRDYSKDDKTVAISSVTFKDSSQNPVELTEGTDYTVSGAMDTDTAGNGKTVNVTVTLTNSNYSLATNTTTTTVNINKVNSDPLNVMVNQYYQATSFSMPITGMPTDAGDLTYTPGTATTTGNVTVSDFAVNASGTVTATLSNGAVGNKITLPVTIGSTNYTDTTLTITITLTNKADAGVSITGVPTEKTYGDADFTLTAEVTNPGTGSGTWGWETSDDTVFQITPNGNKATVKILKAGNATISAGYISETTIGNATTNSITVNRKALTIKALNKSIKVGDKVPDLSNPVLNTDYSVTGLVGTDSLTGPKLVYSSEPDNTKAGTYTITASNASASDNYTIGYQDGTLTISEKDSPTPTPTPAPSAGLVVTTTAKTSARSMTVKWTWNNVPGAKSYKVSYHKVGSKKWTTKKTKKTKYVVKGHKMKGLYEYKVAAVTASGDVWSNTSCRYFKGVKTKAKAGKTAGTVRASWKKDKGATGYQVKLATNKKLNGAQVVNVSADKKSYTFSGLKSGKKYYVSVRPLKDHNGVTYQGIRCKALKVKTK